MNVIDKRGVDRDAAAFDVPSWGSLNRVDVNTFFSRWTDQVAQKCRVSILCFSAGDFADSETHINLCWGCAENSTNNSPPCPGLVASSLLGSEEGNLPLKEDVLADYKSAMGPKLQCCRTT